MQIVKISISIPLLFILGCQTNTQHAKFQNGSYCSTTNAGERIYNTCLMQKKDTLKSGPKDASTMWITVRMYSKHKNINPLKEGSSSVEQYTKNMEYLSFQGDKLFSLRYGASLDCARAFYHFETNYGLTPYETFVLGFTIPESTPRKAVNFQYSDEIFGDGIINFDIDSNTIQSFYSKI